MDPDRVVAFIAEHHRALLATERADGSAHLTPVLAGVDASRRITISTRSASVKVRHLRARPRASLCVFTDAFFGPWVQARTDVQIVDLPDAMRPLEDYYRSLSGEHEDWAAYRTAMREEGRCLLLLTPCG